MKRLQKLVIENFQSHTLTEVDFSRGFNVFVGPSDSGKSSILRALRWVLYNQPRGSEFIRSGKNRCRVMLTLSDGTEITRERSASVNRYTLKDSEGKEKVFEGFGKDVPREVLEAHRMHPLKLDHDWNMPAQFGTQLEGPFLLSETGGVRAKSIGRVSGAHIIDIALRETARDRQALSSQVKHLKEEQTRLEEALKPYENLPELLDRVNRAEKLYQKAEEHRQQMERLKQLREKWRDLRNEQEKVRSAVDRLTGVERAESALLHLERYKLRLERLTHILSNRNHNREEMTRWQTTMEKTSRCSDVERELLKVDEKRQVHHHLKQLHGRWSQCREELNRFRRLRAETDALPRLLRRMEEVNAAVLRYDRMRRLFPRYLRWKEEKVKTEAFLNRTAGTQKASHRLESMEYDMERLKGLGQTRSQWKDVGRRLADGRKFMERTEEEIHSYTKQLVSLFQQLGKCPTCGSSIDGSVLNHIMEEYQGGMTGAAAGREDQGSKDGPGKSEGSPL
ncbi:AAA family ATPase [Paludifilum halophilum]|uniref:Nuclease SbcCD subunit C n=1 Tax=Paludifilum halophilum TaxID=1642702 RepID=A0A235BB54_9BACL|nr:AAA family ATPase [Paludifilum halophilum]OYD09521.1 hypothetical protein CHM34_00425 [Paludifilum halophilum]